MSNDVEWELDDNENWTLKYEDIEVQFLTRTQKEKLKLLIECLKHQS